MDAGVERTWTYLKRVVETNTRFMFRAYHFSTNYRSLSSAREFDISLWDSSGLIPAFLLFTILYLSDQITDANHSNQETPHLKHQKTQP